MHHYLLTKTATLNAFVPDSDTVLDIILLREHLMLWQLRNPSQGRAFDLEKVFQSSGELRIYIWYGLLAIG